MLLNCTVIMHVDRLQNSNSITSAAGKRFTSVLYKTTDLELTIRRQYSKHGIGNDIQTTPVMCQRQQRHMYVIQLCKCSQSLSSTQSVESLSLFSGPVQRDHSVSMFSRIPRPFHSSINDCQLTRCRKYSSYS